MNCKLLTRRTALIACCVLLYGAPSGSPVFAGAWSQPEGGYYAKMSGIFYGSDEVFDEMGMKTAAGMDNESFDSGQGFLYLEYGLRERLTGILKLGGGRLIAEDNFIKQTTKGIGDAEVGLKYQLRDAPVVVAPLVILKLPGGYDENYVPSLGTGYRDLEVRLLTARSLYPMPVYVGFEAGYRVRGGPFSNQIPYFAEIGASPHALVFAKLYVDGSNTLAEDNANAGQVGVLQVSEGDFTKAGINVAFNVSGPLWVDFLWERVVDGKNIGAGGSWGFGLAYTH